MLSGTSDGYQASSSILERTRGGDRGQKEPKNVTKSCVTCFKLCWFYTIFPFLRATDREDADVKENDTIVGLGLGWTLGTGSRK